MILCSTAGLSASSLQWPSRGLKVSLDNSNLTSLVEDHSEASGTSGACRGKKKNHSSFDLWHHFNASVFHLSQNSMHGNLRNILIRFQESKETFGLLALSWYWTEILASYLPPLSLSMVGKRRKGRAEGRVSCSWYCITICYNGKKTWSWWARTPSETGGTLPFVTFLFVVKCQNSVMIFQ